jgi:hypothetical protein
MSIAPPGLGHRHAAFGLTIASDLPLPELPAAQAGADSDVSVRLGEISPELPGGQLVDRGITARPGALLINFETARFLVTDGREIRVQPGAAAADKEVRAYLLGSAMGALLHQRGLLPLHANAIEIDGKAVAFAGPSGVGKSTLAAWFRGRGRRLLSDDVCAVSFDEHGRPLAWPGIPRIKLWADALDAFGHNAGDLERVVNWEEKFSLPITTEASLAPLPLSRIYVLEATEAAPNIKRLGGASAFDALASNVYRSEFAAPLGQSEALFANTLAVLRSTKLFIAERRLGFEIFAAEAESFERHIAAASREHRTGAVRSAP